MLWGVVILLTLTVIGIAASRMATVDSRIAGNQMMDMECFQGSESALATASILKNNKRQRLLYYSNMPSNHDRIMDVANLDTGYCENDSDVYYCDALSKVISDPVISADPSNLIERVSFPVLEGVAISSDFLLPDAALLITIRADCEIPGTGVSGVHMAGWARLMPHAN